MQQKKTYMISFVVPDRPEQYEPLYRFIHIHSNGRAHVVADGAVVIGGYAQFGLVVDVFGDDAAAKLHSAMTNLLHLETGSLAGIRATALAAIDQPDARRPAPWEIELWLRMPHDPSRYSKIAHALDQYGLFVHRTYGWVRPVETRDQLGNDELKISEVYETVYSLVPKPAPPEDEIRLKHDVLDLVALTQKLREAKIEVMDLRLRTFPDKIPSASATNER